MTFPVQFHVAGITLPAHLVFEVLGYTGGFQLFLFLRRRRRAGDPLALRDAVSPYAVEFGQEAALYTLAALTTTAALAAGWR